jgi:hypothetical protein
MSTRVLVIIGEGQEVAALAGMSALVAIARAERATVRLAYFRRVPRPRVDACDRIVVPVEIEMERTEAAAVGRARREVPIEIDAFAPELVVLVTSRAATPLARLCAWALRRRLSRRTDVRLLVLQAPPPPSRRMGVDAAPRWRGDVARQHGGARPG